MSKYIPYSVIAALGFVIFLQQQAGKKPQPEVVIDIQRDTTFIQIHDTTYTDTGRLLTINDTITIPAEYVADTTFERLQVQYNTLLMEHFSIYEYEQLLKKDSITVKQLCKVSANKLYDCRNIWDVHYPVIKESITQTITQPDKRRLYGGFEVGGSNQLNSISYDAGLLYKNRRGRITGFSIGSDTRLQSYKVELKFYWRIL